jgi:threonine dehydrogenase-like Zn-dependent dehydrogenase
MPAPSVNSDSIEQYKSAQLPLPHDYRRWHLYGAGLENVGRDGKPETVALPAPGPDEILVRHDAVGICYSDIKIIALGANHPRLVGRDLQKDPVVMGHEVALTVVSAGENQKGAFHSGQRFIVQADVYYKGVNLAYGYALSGGMSQFGLVGPEVLMGDEGCYLLPIEDETGYVEAALVEPWACVEAAYHWTERRDVAPGDLRFTETPTPEAFEAETAKLTLGSVARLEFSRAMARPVKIDVGRVHYDDHLYVGPKPNARNEIKGGGTAWFIGAAGPMGQMHVQRALSLPHPPARLVTTDRNAERIAAMRARYAPLAAARGVEFISYNVKDDGMPAMTQIAPHGFDDIVVMVPDIASIEEAFPLLAEDGVLNVFAGVARGTMATLDISLVATRNVRIVGTSGSSIKDMVTTRDLMEQDRLDTGASLAAIGGLETFREGLEGVKTGRFPGKTVIFPQIEGLPLTALADLKTVRPGVYAKLKDGQFWTREAEDELLRESLAGRK